MHFIRGFWNTFSPYISSAYLSSKRRQYKQSVALKVATRHWGHFLFPLQKNSILDY